jgi:hypothetical protein
MSDLAVLYPVHTYDDGLLIPAGTVLTTDTLEALISAPAPAFHRTYSLLRHGSVNKDLLSFFALLPAISYSPTWNT